jgi:hypothetical protein
MRNQKSGGLSCAIPASFPNGLRYSTRKNNVNKKPRAMTNSASSLLWGCCTGRNDNSHPRSLFLQQPSPSASQVIQEGKLKGKAPLRRCALLHYLCSVVHYPYYTPPPFNVRYCTRGFSLLSSFYEN